MNDFGFAVFDGIVDFTWDVKTRQTFLTNNAILD